MKCFSPVPFIQFNWKQADSTTHWGNMFISLNWVSILVKCMSSRLKRSRVLRLSIVVAEKGKLRIHTKLFTHFIWRLHQLFNAASSCNYQKWISIPVWESAVCLLSHKTHIILRLFCISIPTFLKCSLDKKRQLTPKKLNLHFKY